MATSSITANFYTDDPKAVNAFARALFSKVKSTIPKKRKSYRIVEHTSAGDNAFFASLKEKVLACQQP